MEPHIRRADLGDPADCAAILELTDAYARDPMGGGVPLSPEVRQRLIPALRGHGGIVALLAFVEGRPAGVCTCVKSISTFAAAPVFNIHDIAVHPGHRGLGIGAALLAASENEARKMGCVKVSLEVLPENRAKRLYERAGFAFTSEFWTKRL